MRFFSVLLVSYFLGRPDGLPARAATPNFTAHLPPRSLRVYALEHAGFGSELETLDELDQDLLYMRAMQKPLAELRLLYPAIAPQKLQALHGFVAEEK